MPEYYLSIENDRIPLCHYANMIRRGTEYVDSAIARNIQHSLKNYRDGNHFRHLAELYEADELTSAINRIVEDINHRFTLSVLTKDFKSNDLLLSAKNLLRDRNEPNTILQQIDKEIGNYPWNRQKEFRSSSAR